MAVLDYTKQIVALVLGGSTSLVPSYMLIGSGSGTTSLSMTTLLNPEDKQLVTSTTYPSIRKVTWQGDWNSVEMSGLSLREFGMCASGAGLIGSIFSRTTTPNIVFDGTAELQIQETWEVF